MYYGMRGVSEETPTRPAREGIHVDLETLCHYVTRMAISDVTIMTNSIGNKYIQCRVF